MFYYLELNIGDQITEQIGNEYDSFEFEFYSLPFLQDGVTLKVNVTAGALLLSASVDERNPTSDGGYWMFNISGYEEIFLHRNDLQQFYDGPVVFVAVYGLNETNNTFDMTILPTTGKLSMIFIDHYVQLEPFPRFQTWNIMASASILDLV